MLQAEATGSEAMTAIKTWLVSRKGKIIKFGFTKCHDQLRGLVEELQEEKWEDDWSGTSRWYKGCLFCDASLVTS
jgi:hypothetical protein